MNQLNDGGQAFPQSNDTWFGSDEKKACPSGMTMRDYFAAHEQLSEWDVSEAVPGKGMCEALAGEHSPTHGWSCKTAEEYLAMCKWEAKWRAALKFIRADAMLAERMKGENQ